MFILSDSSNISEREEVFPINDHPNTGLNYIIKVTDEWMDIYLNQTLSTKRYFFYFFPVGSITYHKSFPDNPKNFLLCFPATISIDNIYNSFVPYLRQTQMFVLIMKLNDRKVPSLRLTLMNHNFELSFSFLPTEFCLSKKPNFSLKNPPKSMLENMSLVSIYAFNNLRDCLLIRENAGSSLTHFYETLLHLKRWAMFKLLYSNSVSGCVNGSALAVMLACTFRRNIPATSIMGNLYIFFRHYIEMNWAKRTVCIDLDNFSDNMRTLVMQNPHLMSPGNGVMTVLTPAMPHRNCTRNINKLTLERIVFQFREAFFVLEKSTWKAGLNIALMQPLTLMDFVANARTIRQSLMLLVLLSVFEDQHLVSYETFCEYDELVVRRLKAVCHNEVVVPYPVAINNVTVEGKMRVHHHFFVHYGDGAVWTRDNPLEVDAGALASGLNYRVEVLKENDNKLLSLNFDNVETIVRVIYTDMRQKVSLDYNF